MAERTPRADSPGPKNMIFTRPSGLVPVVASRLWSLRLMGANPLNCVGRSGPGEKSHRLDCLKSGNRLELLQDFGIPVAEEPLDLRVVEEPDHVSLGRIEME